MHLFQNLNMWASGYDYIANPKTFLLLAFFSRCPTGFAHLPGTFLKEEEKYVLSSRGKKPISRPIGHKLKK